MIIAIAGATASGKTSVAIRLAKKFDAEIISFDSLQVYKYLNIGTAKPSRVELKEVKHHLINICQPDEEFNAGIFAKLAQRKIKSIQRKNKNIILVGGTGLYLKALLEGLSPAPPQNSRLRLKLLKQAEKYGKNYLYQKLAKVDPTATAKIHPHNLPRVIRALEVYCLTGKPFSSYHQQTPKPDYQAHIIGLSWDREILYQRINQRVEEMFKNGLVREARSLLERGYEPTLKPLQSLGYHQVYQYLEEKITLNQAMESTKRDTRHYAKRQISWFRKTNNIKWFHFHRELDKKTLLKIENYVKLLMR